MIDIEYCKDGEAISDYLLDDWLNNIVAKKNENCYYKVSSSLAIMIVRLAIKQKRLDCSQVTLIYEGRNYSVLPNGCFVDYIPKGFADKMDDLLDGLLDL